MTVRPTKYAGFGDYLHNLHNNALFQSKRRFYLTYGIAMST
jgi:hypothetical protein